MVRRSLTNASSLKLMSCSYMLLAALLSNPPPNIPPGPPGVRADTGESSGRVGVQASLR